MPVLSYILEVIVASGLFMVIYRWLIARKVSFGLCRAFILASMLLAAVIPALNVPLYPDDRITVKLVPVDFDGVVDETGIATGNTDDSPSAGKLAGLKKAAVLTALSVYILAVMLSLGLVMYGTVRIARLRRRSSLTYTDDYVLAENEEVGTPFSFFRTIFIGFNYEPGERSQILSHEASHVRHGHSYERLFMSVLRSVFWFNPFFRMAGKDLEEVQEWEADKDVLDEGWALDTYRTTIFKQLFGYYPDITCGLNHSLTKQRFTMMTQAHLGKGAWIRLAAALPVIAAVFFAFGCGVRNQDLAESVSGRNEPRVFQLKITENPEKEGSHSVYCNGELTEINQIGAAVEAFYEGEDMRTATVSIDADENVPMGIITDIKEELRNVRALKIRYESGNGSFARYLPPAKNDYPQLVVQVTRVSRRNLVTMKLNAAGDLLLAGISIKGSLDDEALCRQEIDLLKEIISNPGGDTNLPDATERAVSMPDGSLRKFKVSNALVAFECEQGSSYEHYTKVMNLIATAYTELREGFSAEVFGKSLEELTDAERQVVYQVVPKAVYDSEP
ncbi:MAG: M56 family metallopeptidase [Candidatus Cryptobacteroides sp.]